MFVVRLLRFWLHKLQFNGRVFGAGIQLFFSLGLWFMIGVFMVVVYGWGFGLGCAVFNPVLGFRVVVYGSGSGLGFSV